MDFTPLHAPLWRVAVYEFLGTCIFVTAICFKSTDAWTVPLALFSAFCFTQKVSCGHFNPATSLGVLVGRAHWDRMLMLVAGYWVP